MRKCVSKTIEGQETIDMSWESKWFLLKRKIVV